MVGKIVGYFGLQGWVKVLSHTEPKDNIFSYPQWWLKSSKPNARQKESDWQDRKILKGKHQGKGLVVLFDGIEDRTQAEALLGLDIYIDVEQLAELPEDEFYWKDLIGLQVLNEQGVDFGRVREIMATGANDVLVIQGIEKDPVVLDKTESKKKSKAKNKETLIPYIWEQVIKQVDLDQQRITVAWDEDYLNK